MADLKVDIAVLQASERTLRRLKAEFDGIEDRRDDTRNIWGHDGLREAMHEFASNMDHHRKELSEKIQQTGEKIATTIETFREADEKLEAELRKNTTTQPPAGGPR